MGGKFAPETKDIRSNPCHWLTSQIQEKWTRASRNIDGDRNHSVEHPDLIDDAIS